MRSISRSGSRTKRETVRYRGKFLGFRERVGPAVTVIVTCPSDWTSLARRTVFDESCGKSSSETPFSRQKGHPGSAGISLPKPGQYRGSITSTYRWIKIECVRYMHLTSDM